MIPIAPPPFDRAAPRRAWSRAARDFPFDDGPLYQTGLLLGDKLDGIKIAPRRILNLGDRTSATAAAIAQRWPKAQVITLSLSQTAARALRPRRKLLRAAPPFVAADLLALPFASNSFDLILANLSLHWSGDLPAALEQCRRVLTGDGLLLFSVPGREAFHELAACARQMDQTHGHPHRPRIPQYPDVRELGDALAAAGFTLPVADREFACVEVPTLADLLGMLRDGGAVSPYRAAQKGLLGRGHLRALEELYRQRFCAADGSLLVTLDFLFGHGWKNPDPGA
ncbi:putative type 11 methyltransferase [Magnetofaba australis IT-1]|uniref:Putative type 11 methyltransferase n=2 Tax=Magnetofaba TaxID=1472292 RepID=A0A1Y2K2K2_9PROT|nr:putative type 11 methyltransferase [Magnetofaba australis IT-1]